MLLSNNANLHRALYFILALATLAALTISVSVSPVQAQSNSVGVTIVSPIENETFYAGASSLVYSIDVIGKITGIKGDPSVLEIQLDVFQGMQASISIKSKPKSDGTFKFSLTVNPEASDPTFPLDLYTRGCSNQGPTSQCHYRTAYNLPSGHSLLRVTAVGPGIRVSAERNIVTDHSEYISVPVRVVLADQPEQTVVGVPVIGSTYLYMWRARSATGTTGPNGVALVPKVEVLSEVPTQYVFRVEPSVVDGILYESVKPVQITLPPGATSAAPLTLQVRGRSGKISGSMTRAPDLPVTIHAILLPSGRDFSATTSAAGTFEFTNLPIGAYRVFADDRTLAAQGYAGSSQSVDLLQSPSVSATIPIMPAQRGATLHGTVRDAAGNALPFAWVAVEKAGLTQGNVPGSGAYDLMDLPNESLTAIGSAPGYFNLAKIVNPSLSPADFGLVRRPETTSIAWGTGEIVVPPESRASFGNQQIQFEYGWLWGNGGDGRPLTIRVAEAEIVLTQGSFAIEYLPPNNPGWLYLLDGTATVRSNRNPEPLNVRAGEMMALTEEARWSAVPIAPTVIVALRKSNASPLTPQWETSLLAQVQNGMARAGISVAQTITFATYSAVVLLLIGLPGLALVWGWRRKNTGESRDQSIDDR